MKYWIVGLYIQYKEGKIWGQEFVMIDRSVNGNAGGQFKKMHRLAYTCIL